MWPRGVTVSTLDSESSDRGSNPREAFAQQLESPSLLGCFGAQVHASTDTKRLVYEVAGAKT